MDDTESMIDKADAELFEIDKADAELFEIDTEDMNIGADACSEEDFKAGAELVEIDAEDMNIGADARSEEDARSGLGEDPLPNIIPCTVCLSRHRKSQSWTCYRRLGKKRCETCAATRKDCDGIPKEFHAKVDQVLAMTDLKARSRCILALRREIDAAIGKPSSNKRKVSQANQDSDAEIQDQENSAKSDSEKYPRLILKFRRVDIPISDDAEMANQPELESDNPPSSLPIFDDAEMADQPGPTPPSPQPSPQQATWFPCQRCLLRHEIELQYVCYPPTGPRQLRCDPCKEANAKCKRVSNIQVKLAMSLHILSALLGSRGVRRRCYQGTRDTRSGRASSLDELYPA